MEMNKDCTCKCSEFAPLMSKYMNSGDNEDIIKREMYNPAYGHLPNIDRYPTSNNDGKLVTLSKSANDLQSIVKEGYTSPIKLDTYFKLGEAKLVKLDIDDKNGEAKLVPLEIDEKTGEAKLVTLDVNAKSGEAQLVRLDVDEKTGKAKLVGLEVPKLTGNSKLVILDTKDKTSLPKLIELSVDHKTSEAKLINLDVEVKSGKSQLIRLDIPEIEGKAKLVGLEVENKKTTAKLIPLKVDEKLSNPKMIILDVTNKSSEPKLVNLKVDEIEGKTKLVGLEVNPITSESKLIKLNVPEMDGKSKLVKLEVNPLSGEAKLVRLNVPEIESKAKLVELDVTNKSAEPELVKLHVENKEGEPKLVELNTNDKRVTNRLLNLSDTIGYTDIHEVPNITEKSSEPKLIGLNVDDKIADPRLVILNIDEKTGEPRLVKLNVTELTKEPKIVMLEVDPIMGQARLVRLDVPELTGSIKLVELHVDEKTKEPKLVTLEVTEKSSEPKIIELHVDKKVSDPKVIKLVVPSITKDSKLIELPSHEVTKQSILNSNSELNSAASEKYSITVSEDGIGQYLLDTIVPNHEKFKGSLIDTNKSTDLKSDKYISYNFSEEATDKYQKYQLDAKLPKHEKVYNFDHPSLLDPKDNPEIDKEVSQNFSEGVTDKYQSYTSYGKLSSHEVTKDTLVKEIDWKRRLDENGDEIIYPDTDLNSKGADKYLDEHYIPGTTIPMHRRSAKSIVTPNPTAKTDDEITKLSPEALDKYSKTAAWMGIPGKIGIQAAKDYESIMSIYDSINYQLGGGSSAIERIKSYITASVSGKGNTVDLPSHILESGHILSGSSVVRTANAGVRSVMGASGGVISKSLAGSLSLLGGDVTGALKAISGSTGGAKAKAIHESLVLINNLYSRLLGKTDSRPGQLPGSSGSNVGNTTAALLQGDLKGAVKNAVSGVTNAILGTENRDPKNAPKNKRDGLWDGSYSETWEDPKTLAKSKDSNKFSVGNILKTLGITAGSSGDGYGYESVVKSRSFLFKDRMKTPAMSTTLKELISTDPSDVQSLSKLRSAIEGSNSVITTFSHHLNVRDTEAKTIGSVGLDSNHNWELTLEPLIDDTLNGGFTYLPTIEWINKENTDNFGIKTGYGRWMPFTSFELQDKKLTSKSLNLFDGGITYPVSMEFTNELRLTLVDDQLKTFRRYFDTVAKVSTFESNKYINPSEYKSPDIDESKPLVSSYKNVTFLCTIYVLNNEFATVKKYPLLVTLSDYQIEYTGEVGEGGNDIALHFSIVGELNPDDFNKIRSSSKMTRYDKPMLSNPNNSLKSVITPTAPTANLGLKVNKIQQNTVEAMLQGKFTALPDITR